MYERFLTWCGAAGLAISLGGASALAGTTDVRPAAGGEVGHEQILEQLYGGDFSASGLDYVGGNVTVRRVDDSADRTLSFGAAGRVDLVAAFTGWQWDYSLRDASGNRIGSASQSGRGFDTAGGIDVAAPGSFEMVLRHASGRQFVSSDTLDQLVSYEVSGADVGDETLLFWEDWARTKGSDADFNDLVFRVSGDDLDGGAAAQPAAAVSIPLPPAAWPGVVGLAGVGMVAVRRFRRR
jgi:hypothetical protein